MTLPSPSSPKPSHSTPSTPDAHRLVPFSIIPVVAHGLCRGGIVGDARLGAGTPGRWTFRHPPGGS